MSRVQEARERIGRAILELRAALDCLGPREVPDGREVAFLARVISRCPDDATFGQLPLEDQRQLKRVAAQALRHLFALADML